MLQTPKRRVLNTYSSLPRPGQQFGSPMMGWRYADQAEVAGHTLISRRAPEGGPEYANLIPWTMDNPRVHRSQVPPPTPPRVAHYATLGRAPASKTKLSKVGCYISANYQIIVYFLSVSNLCRLKEIEHKWFNSWYPSNNNYKGKFVCQWIIKFRGQPCWSWIS